MRDVDQAVSYESAVDVVNAHRTVVGTADAAKGRSITGGAGVVHVNKLLGSFPNELHQLGRRSVVVSGLPSRQKRRG